MNIFKARDAIDKIKQSLPHRYKFDYILCDNSKQILSRTAKLFSLNYKEEYNNIDNYLKNNEENYSYNLLHKNQLLPKGLGSKHMEICGMSTNPILINYQSVKTIKQIQFVYLHEVGHLIGLHYLYKGEKFGSEKTANRFAFRFLRRFGYKLEGQI